MTDEHHIRRCIVCGKRDQAAALVRLAVSEGVVCWDKERKLPGRGAHCHPGCVGGLNLPKVLKRAFSSKDNLQLHWDEVLETLRKVFGQT